MLFTINFNEWIIEIIVIDSHYSNAWYKCQVLNKDVHILTKIKWKHVYVIHVVLNTWHNNSWWKLENFKTREMEKTSFNWTNPKQRRKNTRMLLNKKLQLVDNMH
jgi:hypothetical protein